ncbi:hypothetical protein [Robbsia andropogonis]|uniref:hypothetical protein n=1 Tax=Robbsia andropogonis TaxID=28092 RepID=UPI0006859167|nr:hypothetical protein [Robbsia andropogonis]MCP1118875.1 apolipoprotein A1/A4/E family protein [Robbsia andropogonis]MCP1128342.1 apolipoprotein A1/A4/E family protein [Robbsia andropogonis]
MRNQARNILKQHRIADKSDGNAEALGSGNPSSVQLMQVIRDFSFSIGTRLSGMQRDIECLVAGQEHLSKKLDESNIRLENQINTVESRLSGRIDSVESRLSEHIDTVESKVGKRIDTVETKLGARMDGVETRLGTRIDDLDEDIKCHKRLVLIATGGWV